VLGVGAMEVLGCPNPSVLAYVRSGVVTDVAPRGLGAGVVGSEEAAATARPAHDGAVARTVPAGNERLGEPAVRRSQAVLCVHNLSRFAQPAELMLARWAGCTPVEVLGRVPFPTIADEPYTITLGPYGGLWFDLVGQPTVPDGSGA
jgi:maltogenic amylase-like protein